MKIKVGERTTLKFPLVAGLLVRGTFRRYIKSFCFSRDYELDMDEDKGLLESYFRVVITFPVGTSYEELKEAFDDIEETIRLLS